MRSSIACIRCRRSKVKCVNEGVGTTCRSCESSGRECAYPPPISASGAGRRTDSVSGRPDDHTGGEHGRRQRPRKSTHSLTVNSALGVRESARPPLDAVLDSRLLTPQVWMELFDIFEKHYSADLPFLHRSTFLEPLRHANAKPAPNGPGAESTEAAKPRASPEFLLAFLALTARFHTKLVAHHSHATSSRENRPLIASEYYASAANARLAEAWASNASCDIERTQVTLMMALYHWGMCRGKSAWIGVGAAIRAAQANGLQYEIDLDDEPLSRSLAQNGDPELAKINPGRSNSMAAPTTEAGFTRQEIRRRTFWSCYIMDRYLSSGKYRPQMLHASDLRIQLPASDESFQFAEKVRTLMLGEEDKDVFGNGRAEILHQRQQSVLLGTGTRESRMAPSHRAVAQMGSDDENIRLEVGPTEGLLSRYIKILEIYGKVVKWSCSGGRRVEQYPPWDPQCEFYKLRKQCQAFKASLPRQHTLTPQIIQAHVSSKAAILTQYTLVHTVHLLCQIMLHREYLPFVPIRCSKPEGPLDPPTFPPDRYQVPPGFWEESARECFRAAREIIDLVQVYQEWGALVETPTVGFAIYTVAFCGVYCYNFPWMDPDGYMCERPEPAGSLSCQRPGDKSGVEAAEKALAILDHMRARLHMARGWARTMTRMNKYFEGIKSDYRRNASAMEWSSGEDSPVSTRHLSLRNGGLGGGLAQFRQIERKLQEFGELEDQDVNMIDAGQADTQHSDEVYDKSHSGTPFKSEEGGERTDHATPAPDTQRSEPGVWSAINTAPGAPLASRSQSASTPTSAQFRSYESFPSQASQPPPTQPQQTHQPHASSPHGYANPMNGFRPAYSESSGSAGAPPSLTSPAPHSTSASTPSQSHPSPPYDRTQQPYGGWTAHNAPYPMQAPPPPPPNPYSTSNGVASNYPRPPPFTTPYQQVSAYPSAGQPAQPQQPLPASPSVAQAHQPRWDPTSREAWMKNISTYSGGDDLSAFTEGEDMADWTSLSATQGFEDGWLTKLWSLPNS